MPDFKNLKFRQLVKNYEFYGQYGGLTFKAYYNVLPINKAVLTANCALDHQDIPESTYRHLSRAAMLFSEAEKAGIVFQ